MIFLPCLAGHMGYTDKNDTQTLKATSVKEYMQFIDCMVIESNQVIEATDKYTRSYMYSGHRVHTCPGNFKFIQANKATAATMIIQAAQDIRAKQDIDYAG